MPVVKTFISHHGGDYVKHVAPILRQVAPLGVRPWIDKRDLCDRVGLHLDKQLQDAIFKGQCSSLSVFLTKTAATRKWIDQEVAWALDQLEVGFRVLPIWIDPPGSIDLPPVYRDILERRKVLWLEPQSDPRFLEKYTASVLATAGIDKETQELTLYLGHRSEQWDAVLPKAWESQPAIDLRLDVDGHQELSPTEEEWREIEAGLQRIRRLTGQLERINVCGQAPLGVGTLIGKVWDRSAGQRAPIQLRTFNVKGEQIWTTDSQDYDLSDNWKPEHSHYVKMDRPVAIREDKLLLAMLPETRVKDFLPRVHDWNEAREQPSLVHVAKLPSIITSPEHAQQIVRECVGALRFIRQSYPRAGVLEIISGYPLALAPLISYHLRTCGPLHFYDEVKVTHDYRLAAVIA